MQKENKNNTATIILFIIFVYFSIRIGSRFINIKNDVNYQENQLYAPIPELDTYTKLSKSQYPEQTARIKEMWNFINNPKTDPIDRIKHISNSFFYELLSRFSKALYASSEELENVSLREKILIYSTRMELLTVFSMDEILSRDDEKLFNEYFYINAGMMEFSDLELITYVSDSLAYGIYEILNNKKSVQFEKSENIWGANTFKEDPIFDKSREQLIENRILSTGSETAYLDRLFYSKPEVYAPLKKR